MFMLGTSPSESTLVLTKTNIIENICMKRRYHLNFFLLAVPRKSVSILTEQRRHPACKLSFIQ